jgi:hypothetical protein
VSTFFLDLLVFISLSFVSTFSGFCDLISASLDCIIVLVLFSLLKERKNYKGEGMAFLASVAFMFRDFLI